VLQRAAVRQDAVGFDRERDGGGHSGVLCGPDDPERLVGIGDRDRRHHVRLGFGERPDLRRLIAPGLVGGHQRRWLVAVAAGPDAAAHDHRRTIPVDLGADLDQHVDCLPVGGRERLIGVAEPLRPVGACPPGGRLEDEPGPRLARDRRVVAVVAAQRLDAGLVVEQHERREVG
jgi:hypothetical protein